MKKLLFLFALACFYVACSPTTPNKGGSTLDRETGEMTLADNQVNPENNLESYLNRTAGVRLLGSGQNATVQIRGVNSYGSNTQPLFIINGTDVGQNYSNAAGLLRGMTIKSVRVLKGSDATFYGLRGAGGVVVIKAK